MSKAIFFDLGNTLVRYYLKEEFVPTLEKAIAKVHAELLDRGLVSARSENEILDLAIEENRESDDFSITPMAARFERIFGVSIAENGELSGKLCSLFLEPVFKLAYLYPDTTDALIKLRNMGFRLGIVSNLPWGSPPDLWRAELHRLGIADLVDDVTLCGDVGWRKPATQIFERALGQLNVSSRECTFVGDDLVWDIQGSEEAGIRAILIDRENLHQDYDGLKVASLNDLDRVLRQ